jgi:hypothetical protein
VGSATSGGKARQARLAAAGLLIALLSRLLAEVPAAVEWHRVRLFPLIAVVLQRISGGAATTIGEVAAAAGGALVVALLVARRGRVLGALIFAMGFLVFAFYFSWGFAYQYPPLSTKLASLPGGDEQAGSSRLVELTDRSARLLARAASGDVSFQGTNFEFLARLNSGIEAGTKRWPESLEASPVRLMAFGPAKPSRVSFALSRLQISGYYFPWSGEAQIDADMPRSLWPRVAAHEKAHQRGFARENEATVIGLISCLESPDPTVFYGGALGLFVGFDRELSHVDSEARARIWTALPSPVAETLRVESAFFKAHEGVAGKVSEKVNDTYLKAQGVRSGVGSYAETTRLLLQAAQTPGLSLGRLLEEAPRPR